MHGPHEHRLLIRPSIAHHNGAPVRSIPRPYTCPANAVWSVKVVVLFAVGVELTGQTECGELAAARGRKGMVALDTVQIAVKYAGVAFGAEENEGIGKGFEEGLNGCFESLVGLGVMVPVELEGVRWE